MRIGISKDNTYIAKNFTLTKARVATKLTQKELASQIGIGESTYTGYESMTSSPSEKIKKQISRVLGKSQDYLFPKAIGNLYKREYPSTDILDKAKIKNISLDELETIGTRKKLNQMDLSSIIGKKINTLNAQEQEILKYRFWDNLTLEEAGEKIYVTKERARQIEASALKRMRHPSRAKDLKEF